VTRYDWRGWILIHWPAILAFALVVAIIVAAWSAVPGPEHPPVQDRARAHACRPEIAPARECVSP
jgi:hypothetical protein